MGALNMSFQKEKDSIARQIRGLLKKDYAQKSDKVYDKLTKLLSDIYDDKYTIVVLGEFKRGKSTFLNTLLGKSLLPMNVLPETATINIIRYCDTPKVLVHYLDGHQETGEANYDFLKRFSAADNQEDVCSIKYLEIGYPLDFIKENIVLIDTPGVSDLNEQRMEITYGIIPKANVVLFLLDAASPLKNTERIFIENKLLNIGINHIIFIVNRYDFVDEEEEPDFLQDLKDRLINTFFSKDNDSKIKEICVLPLSALTALQGIENNDPITIEDSGLNLVKTKIEELLYNGEIEYNKVQAYKLRLKQILQELFGELENKIALKKADITELEQMSDNLNKLLNESMDNKASIKLYIEESKQIVLAMVNKSVYFFRDKLQEDILDMVTTYQGTGFKEYVETCVVRRMKSNFESWVAGYSPYIDNLLESLEIELSKGLSYFFKQNIQLQASSGRDIVLSHYDIVLSAEDISDVNLKAGAVAALGGVGLMAVAGGTLMPLVGFAALPFLRENMLKSHLAAAKEDIEPQILHVIAECILKLQNEIKKYVDERCKNICMNTEYAYDQVLVNVKNDIDKQINEKKQVKIGIESDIEYFNIAINETQKLIMQLD